MKKATRSEELSSLSHGQHNTSPTLLASVLAYLIFDGSLNKYEAAKQLGDWSLHSTISDLANKYGLSIKRTPEKVMCARNPVTRYSITEGHRRHARAVLMKLEQRKKGVAA